MYVFVSSRLDYCNGLFTGLPKRKIRWLQFIQNATARIRKNKIQRKGTHHTNPQVFQYNSKLSLKFSLSSLRHSMALGQNISQICYVYYKPNRSLRSTDIGQLVVPRLRSKQSEIAFSHHAVHCWNQIPT